MIGIVDYGLGNIKAFINVYKRLNIPACLVSSPEQFDEVSKIILPGVGAFDQAMSKLNNSGLREQLEQKVLGEKIPVLGICVGMQMLANASEEGKLKGLEWIDADILKFQHAENLRFQFPLPHMGWNHLNKKSDDPLFKDLDESPEFYFLHTYYFQCNQQEDVIATAEYSKVFNCVVRRENIYGIQCHPEKSHSNGVLLLKNFAEI